MSSDRFDALVTETASLAIEFTKAEKRIYLVGGIVRDTLLGRVRAELDIDLTTDALPDEIEAIVKKCRPTALWTQGKRFGTIGATITGSTGPRAVEITTHRAEQYHDDSRKPEVRFSTDITLDLSRRDFTVNAMAFDLQTLELLDPFDGQQDLTNRVLRTPLSPEISFRDDPLRMLRASRFLAGLQLTADPDLLEAVVVHGHRMSIVSAERVRGELVKLLTLRDPSNGVRFLASTNLLQVIVPEMQNDSIDLAIRRIQLVDHDDWLLRLVALGWDAFATEKSVRTRLRALKCSTVEELWAGMLFRMKSVDLTKTAATDADARRFVKAAGDARKPFLALKRADVLALLEVADQSARQSADTLAALEARIAALAESENIEDLSPELDGDAVMSLLDLPPGRSVGDALAVLLEIRLNEGPLGREEETRRLRSWWQEHHRPQSIGS